MENQIVKPKKRLNKYVPKGHIADLRFDRPFESERNRIIRLVENGDIYPATVYLMKCNEFYKIGFSQNVNGRVETLQIGNPYKIELLWEDTVYNYMQIEEGLHKKFANKNHRGVWFKLDEEDVDYILSLV